MIDGLYKTPERRSERTKEGEGEEKEEVRLRQRERKNV